MTATLGSAPAEKDSLEHEAAIDLLGRELCRTHLIEPLRFADDVLTVGYARQELPSDIRSAIQQRIGHASIRIEQTNDTEGLRHRLESCFPQDTATDLPESLQKALRRSVDRHAEEVIVRPNVMGSKHIGGWLEMIVASQRSVIQELSPDAFLDLRNTLAQRTFGNDHPHQLQRGQIERVIDGRRVFLRVTSAPAASRGDGRHAHVQLRVQRPYYLLPTIENFGFNRMQENAMLSSAGRAGEHIIIGAPPSNGKSSLGYRLVLTFPLHLMNVFTAEQPAEIFIPGITPLRVDRNGLSMRDALIATLSLNPSLIFVGESLEESTIELVVIAMSAGIPTITTYHADSAADIPYRMRRHGIDPVAIGHTKVLIATRLVPVLCEKCKDTERVQPSETMRKILAHYKINQASPARRRPGGCDDCGHTGASGQTGVAEIFFVDKTAKTLIADDRFDDLRTHLHGQGLPTMLDHALVLYARGRIDERDFLAKIPIEDGIADVLTPVAKEAAA